MGKEIISQCISIYIRLYTVLLQKINTVQIEVKSKVSKNSPTFTGTVTGITKAMVGLGNVENTKDANKPISIAVSNALNTKASLNS